MVHTFARTLILGSRQATAGALAPCAFSNRYFKLRAHTYRHYTLTSLLTPNVVTTHLTTAAQAPTLRGRQPPHSARAPHATAYSLLRTQAPTPRGRPAALRRLVPPCGALQPGSPSAGPLLALGPARRDQTGTDFEPDRALRGKPLRGRGRGVGYTVVRGTVGQTPMEPNQTSEVSPVPRTSFLNYISPSPHVRMVEP
jgi:hypothetical protein